MTLFTLSAEKQVDFAVFKFFERVCNSEFICSGFNISCTIYPSVRAKCTLGVVQVNEKLFVCGVPFQFVGLFHLLNQDFE